MQDKITYAQPCSVSKILPKECDESRKCQFSTLKTVTHGAAHLQEPCTCLRNHETSYLSLARWRCCSLDPSNQNLDILVSLTLKALPPRFFLTACLLEFVHNLEKDNQKLLPYQVNKPLRHFKRLNLWSLRGLETELPDCPEVSP